MACHCSLELTVKECLEDAGCNEMMVKEIISCIENKEKEKTNILLNKYRYKLLDKIHTDQKKLDCLDYLIYKLKNEG